MSERSEADDVTVPLPGDDKATAGDVPDGGSDEAGARRRRGRRRKWVIGGVATAVVLVMLAGCVAAGVLVVGAVRLAERADDDERRRDRLAEACLELETRLNRLTPPGATGGDPRRRAEAIRHENSAVRPLLAELEELTAGRQRGEQRRKADWASAWRQLIEARISYAEALERQATAGEPAFYVAPRAARGGDVLDVLRRQGPDSCVGPVRRLGHPDL